MVTVIYTIKLSHCLYLKLDQLSRKKRLKLALLGNFLSNIFTEVEI